MTDVGVFGGARGAGEEATADWPLDAGTRNLNESVHSFHPAAVV